MMSNCSAILALLAVPGAGAAAVHSAIAASNAAKISLANLLGLTPRALIDALPPGLHTVAGLIAKCGPQHRDAAEALLAKVSAAGAGAVAATDPAYPSALAVLGTAAPPILFFQGPLALLRKPAAAVVGARDPSPTGARLAMNCAMCLARQDAVVVSGGARGIDGCGHAAALEAGGETVVVLPQGILTYKPPPSIKKAVKDGRAAVVSQFMPEAPWETHAAVTRNATVSALANLMCVVEPRKTGGSIRAARIALAQGKPVAAWCLIRAVEQLLKTAGAGTLADPKGNLQREYLRELWCQTVQRAQDANSTSQPGLLQDMQP